MSETKTAPNKRGDTETIFDISASAARVAAVHMAKEDIRYYLCGILVEPNPDGGAFVVGTNGHVLGACADATGKSVAPTIAHVPSQLLKALPRRSGHDDGSRLKYVRHDDAYHLSLESPKGNTLQSHLGGPIHGKFPIWRRVMPDPATLTPAHSAVSAQYLALARKAFSKDYGPAVQLLQGEGVGHPPMVMIVEGHLDCLLVIMPIVNTIQNQDDWVKRWGPQREIGIREVKERDERTAAEMAEARARGEAAVAAAAALGVSVNAVQMTEDPDHVDQDAEVQS